ncbi:MAG: MFS transporter [Candidatus Eremiobacteraeota bacterium]|nr:MFS transporter [Candidatus Eremiobacteraeota bacterium]
MTSALVPAQARSLAVAQAGLYVASFMAVFDIAVVYLALPSIERSIGAGLADQQWIASAYGLMEAGFTLAAGTLGDLYGRKRVYVVGVIIFIVGSIGSGLAPSPRILIASRFVQGIGGAITLALPLGILVSMVEGQAAIERTIRTFATIAGLGAVTAPAVGGILVQALGWRSVFFVNVPISLFVLYAAFVHTPESQPDRSRKLDLWGQITSALALVSFSFAVIEGNAFGWHSRIIVAAALLAVLWAAAFALIERRVSSPMIRFSLLVQPLFAAGVWTLFVINGGFFTLYLIASLFLQDVARVSALGAGWFLLSNNVLFFLANQFSEPVARRLGERGAALLGMGIASCGLLTFVGFHATTPAALAMIPLGLCGLGWGLAFTPINDLAMSVVDKQDDGLASGMLSLGRPLGAVFGTAVFGSLLGAFMQSSLRERLFELNAPPSVRDAIAAAIHHGGLWSVLQGSPHFGLPPHTLRDSIDGGFIGGMHVAGVVSGAVSLVAVAYAAYAYRSRTPVRTDRPQGRFRALWIRALAHRRDTRAGS